jgi:serine phosphatase RsbU (regulator of sigma subunit)
MRNELQLVEGLSSQSCYSSATEAAYVGGDFYDLVRLPERRACVIMGDVSGKGVEAASVSSAVKTALGAYAWEGLRPARMVDLLNDFLLGFSRVETFATLFVGIVDLGNGTLTYCSAGHPPAMLARASTGELVTLGVQSGVVGAFSGLRYQDGETVVRSGDVLVLYTDGVTEARNPDGAFFGEDGLRDAVSQEVSDGFEGLCDRLLHDVSTFTDYSLEDDVALVVLRFDDVGEGGAGE